MCRKKSLSAADKQSHLNQNKTKKTALNDDNIIEKYLNCHNKQDRWRLFSKSCYQKQKHNRYSGCYRLTTKEDLKSCSEHSNLHQSRKKKDKREKFHRNPKKEKSVFRKEKVAPNSPKPFLQSNEENSEVPQLYHKVPDSRALLYKQYIKSLSCPVAVVTPYNALERSQPETSAVLETRSSRKTKKSTEEEKKKSKRKTKKRSRCDHESKKLEQIAKVATNEASSYC